MFLSRNDLILQGAITSVLYNVYIIDQHSFESIYTSSDKALQPFSRDHNLVLYAINFFVLFFSMMDGYSRMSTPNQRSPMSIQNDE